MENTTNINELPVESTPPENRNLPEGQLNSSVNRMIDPNSNLRHEDKHVRFQEAPQNQYQNTNLNKRFEIKDTHKVIILASILFLLFSDPKVKSYVMNILEVIFGKFLKSPTGGTSKIGLAFYASVFGMILFICVSFIDLSAIKLAI
jgi:hypothetical protein